MAKRSTRGGSRKGAKKARSASKSRPARSATGRKAGRKTAGRKTAGRKTRKAAPRRAASARKPARVRPHIGTEPGGRVDKTVQLANPRGSSGPGTNPFPTIPSTGTPAGAGVSRSPYLNRERRRLREIEEQVPQPPSSLDMDRSASAVRTGREQLRETLEAHTETSPAITGGDVDADWEDAATVGDEAPGGDNPTPDQDRVDDIGKALGIQYQDSEELKAADKIVERDKHRWELDPASAEDYKDRRKK